MRTRLRYTILEMTRSVRVSLHGSVVSELLDFLKNVAHHIGCVEQPHRLQFPRGA